MKTSYSLQLPPCLISNLFRLFTPILAPDSPSRGQGTLLILPAWHQRPSLSSSHPPSLLSWSWKNAQIRAWVGGRQGRKERWMSEKKRWSRIYGTFSKLKCWKRLYSTFSREGWWRAHVEMVVSLVELELAAVGLGTRLSHQCVSTGEGGTRVVLRS